MGKSSSLGFCTSVGIAIVKFQRGPAHRPFLPTPAQGKGFIRRYQLLPSVMGIKCLEAELLPVNRFSPKVVSMSDTIAIRQWGKWHFQMRKKDELRHGAGAWSQ